MIGDSKSGLSKQIKFDENQLPHAGMEEDRHLQAGMERSPKFQAAECSVTPGGETWLQDPEN